MGPFFRNWGCDCVICCIKVSPILWSWHFQRRNKQKAAAAALVSDGQSLFFRRRRKTLSFHYEGDATWQFRPYQGPLDGRILLYSKERMLWKQQIFIQLSIRIKYVFWALCLCFCPVGNPNKSILVFLLSTPTHLLVLEWDIHPRKWWMSHRFAAKSQLELNDDLQVLETGAYPSWPLQMLSHKAAAHDLNGPLLCGPLTLCSAVEPWYLRCVFRYLK